MTRNKMLLFYIDLQASGPVRCKSNE